MSEEKLILVSGAVDHGTRSITDVLRRYLQPDETIQIEFGFRKLGFRRGRDFLNRIKEFDRPGTTMAFVFQAPVLLGTLLPKNSKCRRIGLNDWTAAFPNFPNAWKYLLYNWVYSRAINRLDGFYSYAPRFAEYYARFGARVGECFLPIPFPDHFAQARRCQGGVRLLFIGADYKRKAGDVLLERWQHNHPSDVRLSFVCPEPPRVEADGVDFVTNAKPKTPLHRQIFEQSDVFLLPSRSDAFGFALLEAMNFGMVAVTTKTTGAWPLSPKLVVWWRIPPNKPSIWP